MGHPGSDGQTTIVLKNQAMSETSVASEREAGPSHVCVANPDRTLCESANECAWLRQWRAARVRS